MTITIDETDTDWLELIDFDQDVPCSAEPCPRPAEWKLITKCCGYTALACTRHKDREIRNIDNSDIYRCYGCNQKFLGVSAEEFLDVVALG